MTVKNEARYPFSDFCLEVAKGNVPGHAIYHHFSHNESTDTTLRTVWPYTGSYAFPSSASTMTVSSDDANDTSAGTGAQTVLVEGLDADYVEASETVSMNGLTAVTTTNTYLRINRVTVASAGSGGVNAGGIYVGTGTVTSGVPANVYGIISAGYCHSLMGHYTVPANKTWYLCKFRVSSGTQKQTQIRMLVRPYGEVFRTVVDSHFFQNGQENNYQPPIPMLAKTDIDVKANVDATTTALSVSGDAILVDDS